MSGGKAIHTRDEPLIEMKMIIFNKDSHRPRIQG
jgi:hypothetical protein